MNKIRVIILSFLVFIDCMGNIGKSIEMNKKVEIDSETVCEVDGEPKQLYSKSCVLIDGESGRILFGKDETTPRANASTTKILTCIVALENGDMDSIVKASANASSQPKVHLGMKKDEEFYLKDLLYGLMLESFNDCAVAIAEHIAGTTEDFARLMNDKAKEIGCDDTYFITPNGLDAKNEVSSHHTTAADLCRIMRYCCWLSSKSNVFLQITETISYSFQDTKGCSFGCTNHNAFLSMMDGVISGKTGFTGDAGYCYVAALEKDGRKYCIALLACGWPNNRTFKWSDAKKLFNYGLDSYKIENIFQMPELKPVTINGAKFIKSGLEDWKKQIQIQPIVECTQKTELCYLISDKDRVDIRIQMEPNLTAPIDKNKKLGSIQVLLNNEIVKEYPIRIDVSLKKWTFILLFYSIVNEYLCQ